MLFLKQSSRGESMGGNGLRIRRAVVKWLIKEGLTVEEVAQATGMSQKTITKHAEFQYPDEAPTEAQVNALSEFYFWATHGMPRQRDAYQAIEAVGIIEKFERPATKERMSEVLNLLYHAEPKDIELALCRGLLNRTQRAKPA